MFRTLYCFILIFLCSCISDSSLHRGFRFFKRSNYVKAISSFSHYIKNNTETKDNKQKLAVAYFYRGLSYQLTSDATNANKDYSESLKLEPLLFYAWFNKGVIFLEDRNFDLALKCFRHTYEVILEVENQSEASFPLFNRKTIKIDKRICLQYLMMSYVKAGEFLILNNLIESTWSDYVDDQEMLHMYADILFMKSVIHNKEKAEYFCNLATLLSNKHQAASTYKGYIVVTPDVYFEQWYSGFGQRTNKRMMGSD
jgi:tetratricopeptide (TPR) repeat protein